MAETTRDDLIRAILPHIPFDGWSNSAVALAGEDLGIAPEMIKSLLPGGVMDAIDGFTDMADRDMAISLDALDPRPSGTTAVIRSSILCRLENAAPHREAVAASLKVLARPQNGPLAAKILYRTVDRIWRLTGDRAVDFSFYTKRTTLAGVYSAVLLYWVANPSADQSRIEAFLDRRLREVSLIPKVTGPVRKTAEMGIRIASRMIGRMSMRRSG
jgi:ubiquinone biosynthesis protein COQ9